MYRKFLSMLVLLVIASMVIAGCAPAAAPAAEVAAPAAEEEAAAPAEAAETEVKYKVALVIGLLGDKSFLDSAAAGIKMVNEQFPDVETKIIENVDVGEQQLAARAMAEQGFDLVITIGYGSADWTDEIAAAFPDTKFAIVDATLASPNGTGLVFREDEGSFTVGMVAAMLTETGKVGYIGGMDVPLLRRFEAGYIQGVHYVNPDIEVVSGWIGDFNDANKGKELALTQYEEGVDIIFAAAGKAGEGALNASEERGLYSIGVDSDQDHLYPGHVITSMMKRVDLAVFGAVSDLREGKLEGGTKVFGLLEDGVGMCYLYDYDTIFLDNGPEEMVTKMKEEVIPAVEAAVEKIKAGEMCVTDYMEVFPCENPAAPGGMAE
jgi:basic membrane protein A